MCHVSKIRDRVNVSRGKSQVSNEKNPGYLGIGITQLYRESNKPSQGFLLANQFFVTLPETNIASENRPSQTETSIPTINFQVRAVSFRECNGMSHLCFCSSTFKSGGSAS